MKKAWTSALFRRRAGPVPHLRSAIDTTLRLLNLLQVPDGPVELALHTSHVLELEIEFDEQHERFLNALNRKRSTSPYWQDLYDLFSGLKKSFCLLIDHFHKVQIFQCTDSFRVFLLQETRILDDVRLFIDKHLYDPRYTEEILKSCRRKIEELSQIYLEGMVGSSPGPAGEAGRFKVLETFEELNRLNRNVHDRMRKICIESRP